MLDRIRDRVFQVIGVLLCIFTLSEVNYPFLAPLAQVAGFAMLGLCLVFLKVPMHRRLREVTWAKIVDWILVLLTISCFGYVFIQSDARFEAWWVGSESLGNRAGRETPMDLRVGLIGLLLVLEAARRAIGLTLPILALTFVAYAYFGPSLPDWLFPHRGYSMDRIVGQTFLHSQGVFGIALKVMFTYVFLFVIFGALLEKTGATGFIIDFARKLFRNSAGGPAKVSVISSGMMGSLSGSAVANTATTGTFTIPMMRASGFSPKVAAGVEAAASSGGALVPPVMGAGAYMMLEIIPDITFMEIVKAAVIPAVLYYTALLLIVHFTALRVGAGGEHVEKENEPHPSTYPGIIFFVAFVALIGLLVIGYTPFRAVSLTLLVILIMSFFDKHTRLGLKELLQAFIKSAAGGIPLVAAASCVGIIIGVVTLTGVGSKLPGMLLPLAQQHLVLGLAVLMVSTIILGMGLPSAVCYLLMATLVGPALGDMGVVVLAAHLFIFYFGMMSMVTPPVALAAYTAATIADSDIMATGVAAFRFALIGFALPYAFVLRPELLLIGSGTWGIVFAIGVTLVAVFALATAISGYWFAPLPIWQRALLLAIAFILLLSRTEGLFAYIQAVSVAAMAACGWLNKKAKGIGAA
ncbi:MAG: TRAP transporter fused permease subunit [Acidobacteriota bacterium]|nr:TRAP transporter fused permease subunit [Acidobacteriota bacterium]